MECDMTSLLIYILVAVIVLGLIYYVITLLPLPAPFALIARVLFIVIVILMFIYALMPVLNHGPHP
jgi:hypothetical protein